MKTFSFSVIALLMLSTALVHAGGRRDRGGAGGVGGGENPHNMSLHTKNCFEIYVLIKEYRKNGWRIEPSATDTRRITGCGISLYE